MKHTSKIHIAIAVIAIVLSFGWLSAEMVTFGTVNKVAEVKAQSVWGNDLSDAQVIPYLDLNGEVLSYEFCYRTDGNSFPSETELSEEMRTDPKWFKNYCHVLASARYDLYPIPACGEGLPAFFTRMEAAREVAEDAFGSKNVEFVGIQAIPFTPLDVFFIFESNGKTLHINPYKQEVVSTARLAELRRDFCGDEGDTQAAHENAEAWQKMIESATSGQSYFMMPEDHYVENWGVIEPLDWQYGCTPTAYTILLSYYDYKESGYGKLLSSYFYRVDRVSWNKKNFHVPLAQRLVAICLDTDTTTGTTHVWYNRSCTGMMKYTNDSCGYNFEAFWTVKGTSSNNYLWDTLVAEVEANRPCEWGEYSITSGHSTAAFGYTDAHEVILYNTWDPTVERWYYKTFYSGDGTTKPLRASAIMRLTSGGGFGFNVHLLQPDGGQEWGNIKESTPGGNGEGEQLTSGQIYPIRWATDSLNAGYVKLYLSTNQGKSWQVITDSTENDGEYEWEVSTALASAPELTPGPDRLCAIDGSFGDFTIDQNDKCRIKIEAYTGFTGIEEVESGMDIPLTISAVEIQRRTINFAYEVPASTPYVLRIYDVTGRGVHSQSGQFAGSGQITCSPELTQGVYFWRIATELGEESGKFVWLR